MVRKAVLTLACTVLGTGAAVAQEFPQDKPITIVVGFVAGGAADSATRLIASKLAENTGTSIAVLNRAGAGGNIAHQYVSTQPADGTVLLLGSVGPLTIAPHLMDVPYDPFKDLAPVSGAVHFPNVLVAHKGVGVNNFQEFIKMAKEHPEKGEFASTGMGSASHLAGELLNMYADIELVHVPYKGGAQAMQDLIGQRVASYFSAPPTALPYIKTGQLVALATTGLERPAYLPEIPTVAEEGYPGFEALNWYSFMAPGKTPEPILERWNQEIVKVLNDPEIKKQLGDLGLTPHPTTRAEFAEFMKAESDKWAKIIKERNIVMQ
ncbi:MAG TPA: tripartite tricarboxylate transporter substrate binding protein [Burkholderiaceae bacterium]|nr:tripartite tricarboxylate transporter substrate binding protein [Burkholderiaceae bacterium]